MLMEKIREEQREKQKEIEDEINRKLSEIEVESPREDFNTESLSQLVKAIEEKNPQLEDRIRPAVELSSKDMAASVINEEKEAYIH